MIPYLSSRKGRYPFCEGCPARDYCLGKKTLDPEDGDWISEVCYEQRGEYSVTYGRIEEDDPSFNYPEPPEPFEEYIPEPKEAQELFEGGVGDEL